MGVHLLNCWYGLAWAAELGAANVISRTILGMKLVIFRGEGGRPSALIDRCPHRFAPLSLGQVSGGILQCGYHGLGFNGEGACVSNSLGATPKQARVRSFPVVERDKMLWIWPGDPAAVDETTIPEFAFQNDGAAENNWVIFGQTHVACNYELETDNLMDLSHVEFLHKRTFGGRGVIQRGEHEVREIGSEIHSNWWMPGIPEFNPATGAPTGALLDHFLDMRWSPPCSMRLQVGFLPHGKFASRSKGPRVDLPGQFSAHIITPEADRTCHYFWSANRPTGSGPFVDGGDEAQGLALFKLAFEIEDKPMLEAVDANMDHEFWEQKPIMLRNDLGAVRARRQLAKLIAEENAQHPTKAAALDAGS